MGNNRINYEKIDSIVTTSILLVISFNLIFLWFLLVLNISIKISVLVLCLINFIAAVRYGCVSTKLIGGE